MTESPETYQVGHVITDSEMVEYQLLKSLARKILQAHRSGSLGLIKERERIMGQLASVIDSRET
jgi:hypothetical protein